MRFLKETLSTANRAISAVQSVADAARAMPATLEQHRELLKEQYRRDESRKAGLARIAELESVLNCTNRCCVTGPLPSSV